MLKQRNEQIQFLVRVLDLGIAVVAFGAAYWIRISYPGIGKFGIGAFEQFAWLLTASIVIHLFVYQALGFYESLRLKKVHQIILMVVRALLAEVFILGSLVFLIQAKDTSRTLFVIYLVLNYAMVLGVKISAKLILSSFRRRKYNIRQILIYGHGQNAKKVIDVLRRNAHWGYLPCGILVAQASESRPEEVNGVPVLGDLSELERIVKERAVDELIIAQEVIRSEDVERQAQLCEKIGIPVRFSLSLFELQQSKFTYSKMDSIPMLTFYNTRGMTPTQAFLKRAMDLLVSMVGLLITVLLSPWIIWKIRRESPGPIIYKQRRVGENGRIFKCYKFRTMCADAEKKKEDLLKNNEMEGPIFKVKDDPRVTEFGAFLRRTSLDELPQFFNILRGDMSVVGTRPPTPDEVEHYEPHYRRRLSIRPGLTGLWQVSGRNRVNKFEEILALDLKYIDQWSIWLDFKIILQTIWVVLFRRGAY